MLPVQHAFSLSWSRRCDPEFLETAKKSGLQINPMSGADLTDVVMKTINAPEAIIKRYQVMVEEH